MVEILYPTLDRNILPISIRDSGIYILNNYTVSSIRNINFIEWCKKNNIKEISRRLILSETGGCNHNLGYSIIICDLYGNRLKPNWIYINPTPNKELCSFCETKDLISIYIDRIDNFYVIFISKNALNGDIDTIYQREFKESEIDCVLQETVIINYKEAILSGIEKTKCFACVKPHYILS